jgi:hypothetical protein
MALPWVDRAAHGGFDNCREFSTNRHFLKKQSQY